jgi:hypothetical protein
MNHHNTDLIIRECVVYVTRCQLTESYLAMKESYTYAQTYRSGNACKNPLSIKGCRALEFSLDMPSILIFIFHNLRGK